MTSREWSVPRRADYGGAESQHLELTSPRTADVRGLIALIHGGYWRAALDASLMHPLVRTFASQGWMVANLEYRRGEDGPWPAPLEDCRAALAVTADIRREAAVHGPIVSIGHSVGGQLALLTAELVDAVVALAPVTDVAATYADRAGDDAAREYFGVSPEEAPEIYRHASPVQHVATERPTLLVHGTDDARVSVDHSRRYARRAKAAGGLVEFREYAQLSHLAEIDPVAAHWPDVIAWVDVVRTRSPSTDLSRHRTAR